MLLATNMIAVGVDVSRLGVMVVVANQPKSTAEYIQATSRVGRAATGLVFTVYNWARPRDLSHYETFGRFHETIYRHVEALSVTPFAPRAVDRGLTGVLMALIRNLEDTYNANLKAQTFNRHSKLADHVVMFLKRRAGGGCRRQLPPVVGHHLVEAGLGARQAEDPQLHGEPEGIFLRFDEERLRRWEQEPEVRDRARLLITAHCRHRPSETSDGPSHDMSEVQAKPARRPGDKP